MSQDIETSRQLLLGQLGEASRLNQGSTDLFDEAMSDFLGVNRTDSRCLDVIDRCGKVSAGQLASEIGLTTGAVTAVIDRLEVAGYVLRTRDPLDRRKVWIECTAALKAIIGQVYGFYETVGPMLSGRFSTSELEAILTFLRIGSVINQEFAAKVREHGTGAEATPDARAKQAALIRQTMDDEAGLLQAKLDKVR